MSRADDPRQGGENEACSVSDLQVLRTASVASWSFLLVQARV